MPLQYDSDSDIIYLPLSSPLSDVWLTPFSERDDKALVSLWVLRIYETSLLIFHSYNLPDNSTRDVQSGPFKLSDAYPLIAESMDKSKELLRRARSASRLAKVRDVDARVLSAVRDRDNMEMVYFLALERVQS